MELLYRYSKMNQRETGRRDSGMISPGFRLVEERLIKEKELQKRVGRLQV